MFGCYEYNKINDYGVRRTGGLVYYSTDVLSTDNLKSFFIHLSSLIHLPSLVVIFNHINNIIIYHSNRTLVTLILLVPFRKFVQVCFCWLKTPVFAIWRDHHVD